MRSIHDNIVYAYAVECRRRRIVLHTEHRVGGGAGPVVEYTDVVVDGVLAHHFETVFSGNILFSIDEVDVARLVSDASHVLARGKPYGLPEGVPYNDPSELPALLAARGVGAFEISSSHGLTGWVLAETMTLRARAAAAPDSDDTGCAT